MRDAMSTTIRPVTKTIDSILRMPMRDELRTFAPRLRMIFGDLALRDLRRKLRSLRDEALRMYKPNALRKSHPTAIHYALAVAGV